MLDIKFIRANAEAVAKGARDKRITFDVNELLDIDTAIRPLQQDIESLQAERNRLSKTIGKADPKERESLKAGVAAIKAEMQSKSEQFEQLKSRFDELMLLVPQPARSDVPVGKDDSENVVVRTWGDLPRFDFEIRDHVELGLRHGILDIERGVKLAGSRSYILRAELAQLEFAVLRYTVDKLAAKGYEQLNIPVLVREDCMVGTGYFPSGREQAYCVEKDEMALVGTGEVSLTSFHADEILGEDELPRKIFAQSTCFRREAGTYGKDTHGLYRVHQFQKVEQVILCPASEEVSAKMHDELLGNAEELMQDLELPYRVVYVCTGDLGQGQVRKHDIEAWMPSRAAYSETHSCSTFHEFQSRRLKIRYKNTEGTNVLCHTLNNTAVATPRILIPLLEVHQQADGRIRIPQCLRAYMQNKEFIGKKIDS